MTYCYKCGSDADEKMNFCSACGAVKPAHYVTWDWKDDCFPTIFNKLLAQYGCYVEEIVTDSDQVVFTVKPIKKP